jgi:hypothetical protein
MPWLRRRAQRQPNNEGLSVLGAFRTLAGAGSDLMSRFNLASAAGLTFGGKRDLYSVLGYPRALSPKDYRDRYKRGDIAARIVEAFPEATWSGGLELVEDENPKALTPFEAEMDALDKRLGVWSVFNRVDILAGLGEFAIVLIGAAGKLEEELPPMSSQEEILYLTPYGPDEVQIETCDENTESPRFGMPLTYTVQRSTTTGARAVAGRSAFTRKVHWTRVLHFADGILEDAVFGTPRLEKVWNRLDDLDKIVGGGSEAFWLRIHQGYHWNVEKDVKIGPDQIKKLEAEAEEFSHQLRRSIATRGMKLEVKGSDVSTFNNQVMSIISLVSGATGIPQRILLGSERGELASTQDKENWNERVKARRAKVGDPHVRQFVERVTGVGAVPTPVEYDIRWPEIKTLTQDEQAKVASAWAGLSGAAGGVVVTPEEIRDRVLGLDPLPEDEEMEAPVPEEGASPA